MSVAKIVSLVCMGCYETDKCKECNVIENSKRIIDEIREEVIEECIEKLYEVTPKTVDEKLDMVFVNALRELKENK